MLFHLTGIKEAAGKNYTLDFLIQEPDISKIKNFLSEQKVVVIWLENYSQPLESFGKTHALLEGEKSQQMRIISNIETIDSLLAFLLRLEFKVLQINDLANTLSLEESQAIIQKHLLEEQRYIEAKKKEEEKKDQSQKSSFYNKKLKKAHQTIDEVIDQFDQITSIAGNSIQPSLLKKLDDTRANISKLRLATNYDKILEELDHGLKLIIESQNVILSKIDPGKVFAITEGSLVSNIDIIKEQTKLTRIKLMGDLGAQLTTDEGVSYSLKILRPLIEFLQKDIKSAMQDKLKIWENIFAILSFLLLFVIIELSFLNIYLGDSFGNDRYGLLLLYFGLFAIILSLAQQKLHPKNVKSYIGILFGVVVVYAILLYLLKIFLVI